MRHDAIQTCHALLTTVDPVYCILHPVDVTHGAEHAQLSSAALTFSL